MLTKKLIFITFLSFAVFFSFGQNKQPSKKELLVTKVEYSIQSGKYEISVNRVHPMRSSVLHLTSEYNVRISGDSAYVNLPYFGRVYVASFNEDGGIKLATSIDNYKVENKKGKNYSIDFSAKGSNDVFRFSITVWTNGTASINVTCNNRQGIRYSGEMKL